MTDGLFRWIFLGGFVIGSVVRSVYTRGRRRAAVAESAQTAADTLLILLASVGLTVLPIVYLCTRWLDFANYALPAWAGWTGAAIFAVALWLLWRSHVDLGVNWSPKLEIREGHRLVTGGVYSRIRHPMYAAHWLWGAAQTLLLHNWIAGPAILVLFLPVYLLRASREERMMLDRFGEPYRLYMRRTGRIVPRLGRAMEGACAGGRDEEGPAG